MSWNRFNLLTPYNKLPNTFTPKEPKKVSILPKKISISPQEVMTFSWLRHFAPLTDKTASGEYMLFLLRKLSLLHLPKAR